MHAPRIRGWLGWLGNAAMHVLICHFPYLIHRKARGRKIESGVLRSYILVRRNQVRLVRPALSLEYSQCNYLFHVCILKLIQCQIRVSLMTIIRRNIKCLLHIHTRKECPVLGIQILLATRATSMMRGTNGRYHRLGILWVQIRAPVMRP